jgi:hypothetical protein
MTSRETSYVVVAIATNSYDVPDQPRSATFRARSSGIGS